MFPDISSVIQYHVHSERYSLRPGVSGTKRDISLKQNTYLESILWCISQTNLLLKYCNSFARVPRIKLRLLETKQVLSISRRSCFIGSVYRDAACAQCVWEYIRSRGRLRFNGMLRMVMISISLVMRFVSS